MPPKGWRKYADGFRPVNSSGQPLREKENYSIEDLLLPRTTVTKLAKEVLPADTQIPKDGVTALLRASTVFISYISTACRKVVKPQDVFKALENVNLAGFIPEIRQDLEKYEAYRTEKKTRAGSSASEILEDISDDEEKLVADEETGADHELVNKKLKLVEEQDGRSTEDETEEEIGIADEEDDPSATEAETTVNSAVNETVDADETLDEETAEMEDSVGDLGNANTNANDSDSDEEEDHETVNFRAK